MTGREGQAGGISDVTGGGYDGGGIWPKSCEDVASMVHVTPGMVRHWAIKLGVPKVINRSRRLGYGWRPCDVDSFLKRKDAEHSRREISDRVMTAKKKYRTGIPPAAIEELADRMMRAMYG